jgi:hypothetical protein
MGPRFTKIEREQPILLPNDLREWIPQNDIVNFTIEAASTVPMDRLVAIRPLRLISALLVALVNLKNFPSKKRKGYSTHSTISSRRIAD